MSKKFIIGKFKITVKTMVRLIMIPFFVCLKGKRILPDDPTLRDYYSFSCSEENILYPMLKAL